MRRPAVRFRPALLAVATLALAACSSDATDPAGALTDAEVSADVAAAAGPAIAADVASFDATEQAAGIAPGSTNGCALLSGRFRCTAVTASGVTTTRTFAFLDAAGATQSAYDASTTARVDATVDVAGSASGTARDGGFVTKFHRTRSHSLSGLAGAETQRTWDGVGAGLDSTTITGSLNTRQYVGQAADTTTAVVVKLPRSANPYPVSGQHVRVVNATLSVEGRRVSSRQVTRRAVVTFNGTAAVPMTINGVVCTLHLDTRSVDGCTR